MDWPNPDRYVIAKSVMVGDVIGRRRRAVWGREKTLDKHPSRAGLSLLFANGHRPSADDIERLLASADQAVTAVSVSFRPRGDAEGMVELLVGGLTFDLCGLMPGAATPVPPERHRYGAIADSGERALEAITLIPADHIASGYAMIPVVQAMAGLAAHIALPLVAEAVFWHPARTCMEPQYFSRIVSHWLSGGPFPALGLTALEENPAGFRSAGLRFFTGQELQVDCLPGEAKRETAKVAIRLVDRLVSEGPFTDNGVLDDPAGERLHIELSERGALATIRRVI